MNAINTVLVVEDSITHRRMISSLLASHNFIVVSAINGKEALNKAQYAQPDIILLNLNLPDMSAYELCRRLRNSQPTKNIPIVACSSDPTTISRYWSLKQGASAYLKLPLQPQVLLTEIAHLLAQNTSEQSCQSIYS